MFEEEGIYRIDHYMGKEIVQNLLVFRFANAIFEPIWNRNYIDHIQVTAAEAVGVEGRGGYYDSPSGGAMRDMVASHLLQVMAAVVMEPPVTMVADDIRREKIKVLSAMRQPTTGRDRPDRRTWSVRTDAFRRPNIAGLSARTWCGWGQPHGNLRRHAGLHRYLALGRGTDLLTIGQEEWPKRPQKLWSISNPHPTVCFTNKRSHS